MELLVVVLVLIASHVIAISVGFLLGTKIGEWRMRRLLETEQRIAERAKLNGNGKH